MDLIFLSEYVITYATALVGHFDYNNSIASDININMSEINYVSYLCCKNLTQMKKKIFKSKNKGKQ